MRYPASEKLEIIRTSRPRTCRSGRPSTRSAFPTRTTFYAWLDRYASDGFDALEDRKPPAEAHLEPHRR